jgi:hypothetical protein
MSENQASLLLRKQLKGEAVVLLFFFFFFDLSFHCFSPFDDGLWCVLCSLWSGSNLRLLLCSLLLSRGYLYVRSSLLLLRSDLVPMIVSAGISFEKT